MKKFVYLFLAACTLGFTACDDDDVKLPKVKVEFSAAQVGFEAGDTSEDIAFSLNRAPAAEIKVTVKVEPTGVEYGTHFTTNPAAVANVITVTIPAQQASASFSVAKVAGVFLEDDETVKFTITGVSSTGEEVVVGEKTESVLTFGSIISAGSAMTIEGNKDPRDYFYSVYVDMSNNKQVQAPRASWNLGFYCGDEFRVILNGAYKSAATTSGKTDLAAVTVADANALPATRNIAMDPMMAAQTPPGLDENCFDKSDGSLSGTAFAEVSATDAANEVYFVVGEPEKATGVTRDQWYKVKVTRDGTGYKVQYCRVGETTVNTVSVPKKAGYNFTFLSLETATIVDVEPQNAKWDFKWSFDAGYATSMAAPLYMFMQDFVSINYLGGAQAAEVLVANKTYEAIALSDMATLAFSKDRDVIGDRWRATGGMGGAVGGVKKDRFYVIKDPAGNYYKLKFEAAGLGNETTERGRPQIRYDIIK